MKKHTTLASMAKTLGLSRSTVSEILNGKENYSEETVSRVKNLAAARHYHPNRAAQATRRGRSNLIGILHSGGTLQVPNERAYHLGKAIGATAHEFLVGDWLWHSGSSLLSLVRLMLASRVEGIIFSDAATFTHADTREILALINSADIPAVIISAPHQPNIPAINADFEQGFYDLTRHLLSTGRERLTLQLADRAESSWHGILRQRGFCRAIQEAGGVVHDALSVWEYRKRWKSRGLQGEILFATPPAAPWTPAPFSFQHDLAQQVYESLFQKDFATEGIVASNDEWAASIINTGLRHGLSVPGTFGVTGFDNSFLSTMGPVPITTASQETEQTCRMAVDILLQRIQGNREPGATVLMPCPLLLRESTTTTQAITGARASCPHDCNEAGETPALLC